MTTTIAVCGGLEPRPGRVAHVLDRVLAKHGRLRVLCNGGPAVENAAAIWARARPDRVELDLVMVPHSTTLYGVARRKWEQGELLRRLVAARDAGETVGLVAIAPVERNAALLTAAEAAGVPIMRTD